MSNELEDPKKMHVGCEHVSGMHAWLAVCHLHTLYPGGPWLQIQDRIAEHLATIVEKYGNVSVERMEAILQLLGPQFVLKYLSNVHPEPGQKDLSKQVFLDTRTWLIEQLQIAIKEAGYESLLSEDISREKPMDILQKFRRHTALLFQENLDLFLFKEENKRRATSADYGQPDAVIIKPDSGAACHLDGSPACHLDGSPAHHLNSSPSHLYVSASTSQSPDNWNQTIKTPKFKSGGAEENEVKTNLWSHESEAVGRVVCSVLQKHPGKIDKVAGALKGSLLPGSLRRYIWTEVLFQSKLNIAKNENVERSLRQRFGQTIQQNMKKLHVKQPIKSPINDLIENAVIETYNKTACMQGYRSVAYMKEAARVLNVLYMYDQSYQPFFIHWLFPLQVAFTEQSGDVLKEGAYIYELALYLSLVQSCCFPTWPMVLAIAERVMSTLERDDPDLHQHLCLIASVNMQVNPKEFLIHLIKEERTRAEKLLSQKTTGMASPTTVHWLAQPAMFIRQWIGEGFVGKLDIAAVLWVWDQFFLQRWHPQVLHDICIALILLLREHFMAACDYIEMKQVFFSQPFNLLTLDLQKAYISIQKKKLLQDIPGINRQSLRIVPEHEVASVLELPAMADEIPPIYLRDIHLKLDFPPSVLEGGSFIKEVPWSQLPDSNKLVINIRYLFGTESITAPHVLLRTKVSNTGTLTYIVGVDSNFTFDDFDTSHYASGTALDGYPYAILSVEYLDENNTVPLGWAYIPLMNQLTQKWPLLPEQSVYALHSGTIPDVLIQQESKMSAIPVRDPSKRFLGYYSEVLLTVSTVPSEQELETEPESTDSLAVLWSEHNSETIEYTAETAYDANQGFNICVDGVRMLPDNASIIKVVLLLIQPKSSQKIEMAPVYPNINSTARCPTFSSESCQMVNVQGRKLSDDSLILLTILTIDMNTSRLSILGSALVPVFEADSTNKMNLCTGGHQLHLRNGTLDITQPQNIRSSSLDAFPIVPACSVILRLLPLSQEVSAAPNYLSGYYRSEECKPTISEKRIFESYQEQPFLSTTVKDVIYHLQDSEEDDTGQKEVELDECCKSLLDTNNLDMFPRTLNVMQCVSYRAKVGMKVKIEKAFNLKGQHTATASSSSTTDSYGGVKKFITLKHDCSSFLHSPVWQDKAQSLHPLYDENTCLLIQVIGLEMVYQPNKDPSQPGLVHSSAIEGELQLGEETLLGWTALNLFESNVVRSGQHYLPLIAGKPSQPILQQLSQTGSVHSVFSRLNPARGYGTASLLVSLWDGHFEYDELPLMLSHEDLLDAVGRLQDYQRARLEAGRDRGKGDMKRLSDLILKGLEQKRKHKGTNSKGYVRELEHFEQTASNRFYDLMESSLLDAGSGPL